MYGCSTDSRAVIVTVSSSFPACVNHAASQLQVGSRLDRAQCLEDAQTLTMARYIQVARSQLPEYLSPSSWRLQKIGPAWGKVFLAAWAPEPFQLKTSENWASLRQSVFSCLSTWALPAEDFRKLGQLEAKCSQLPEPFQLKTSGSLRQSKERR
jgi:hypothetical protein